MDSASLNPEPTTAAAHGGPVELHRLCIFELDLTCGHCVTVSLNGWYPVSVTCCDRLGGAWYDGTYYPFDSQVDYVRRLEERYEPRPSGAERKPLRVLDRRARTDNPVIPMFSWQPGSAGRYPVPHRGAARRRPARRHPPPRRHQREPGGAGNRAMAAGDHRESMLDNE